MQKNHTIKQWTANVWKGPGSCRVLLLAWDVESASIARLSRFEAAPSPLDPFRVSSSVAFRSNISKINMKRVNIYIIADETAP